VLPLRIFEARYLDMVRERMRVQQPFGVCLITRGGEVGQPAEHEDVGCLARIVDWDMTEPGILSLGPRASTGSGCCRGPSEAMA
jgi:Lon protease-like protein